jgi:16S rRNA (guanine527-N7)-methyltransferase
MISKGAFQRGFKILGLGQNDDLAERLGDFVADLVKWNKVYNLTAIREPQQILSQHIFDSLSVHRYITGQTIIDVGTGGGFPGVPLAMLMPNKSFTLLDSNGKKTRFLQQMIINHGLTNCEVVQSRAESYKVKSDLVICRAFASLVDIVGYAGHLVEEGGSLLAMKGHLEDELDSVPDAFEVTQIVELDVPDLPAERRLVVMKPRAQ